MPNESDQINKTLNAKYAYFPTLTNISRVGDFFVAGNRGGEIITPIAHPTQAAYWAGFQVHPKEQDIKVAIKVPSPEDYANPKLWSIPSAARQFSPKLSGYQVFDDNTWKPTERPIFQDIPTIRNGMHAWSGSPFQFHLKLAPGATFHKLIYGYKVYLDLIGYLSRVAIPKLLKQTVSIVRADTWVEKGSTKLPTGFAPELIQELSVKPLDSLPLKALLQNQQVVVLALKEAPPQPATLQINVIPHVEYARGLYQIEKIPTVVVRSRDPINIHQFPGGEESVLVNDSESATDKLLMGYDLGFDISIMADREEDSRAIANQLMRHIGEQGHVYLPPFDLVLGAQVSGGRTKGMGGITPLGSQGGLGAGAAQDTIGGLPTISFQLLVRRISD